MVDDKLKQVLRIKKYSQDLLLYKLGVGWSVLLLDVGLLQAVALLLVYSEEHEGHEDGSHAKATEDAHAHGVGGV